MIPTDFEGTNAKFGAPPDMAESQVATIPVFVSTVNRGSCEGARLVVAAWKPTPDELRQLNDGNPVFLSCLGGLPPHFLTTNLAEACNPA
jgi:hypothetical protein